MVCHNVTHDSRKIGAIEISSPRALDKQAITRDPAGNSVANKNFVMEDYLVAWKMIVT